jgi:DNA mismatch endonuclease, patch repair protein
MNNIKVPRFKKEFGFITTKERSALMSKIKSVQTKPELLLRKKLWGMGIRYRINSKKLPGKPDIIIKSKRLIIFVDGEFWHGYQWEIKKTKIKTNRDFWIPKIERNMQRDVENNILLKKMGYTVLRFWDHQIYKNLESCIEKILELLIVK